MSEESKFSPSNTKSMSDDIRALAASFALAKKEFTATGKSGKNNHQGYTYAKIGDIYNGVDGALLNHDIVIWHFTEIDIDNTPLLRTRLVHAPTGQYIESIQKVASERPGSQGYGAALTYARRYALLCLCAIATEDDDGADEQVYIAKKQSGPLATPEQVLDIKEAIKTKENKIVLWRNIAAFNKIETLEDLPADRVSSVMEYLAKN